MPKRSNDLPTDDSSHLECPRPRLGPSIPPCPDGNAQRRVEIVGFRLKGADYLQLRVVLFPTDRGICHVTLEEYPDQVLVDAVSCEYDPLEDRPVEREWTERESPCNNWLGEPLGDREVIDIETGLPLPLCIPGWGRGVPTRYIPRPAGSLWPPAE
jgi:hypothetical protein